MKTSEFSPTPSDQTPRFSISEFSVLSVVQNGKLGVGKTRSLVKRLKRALRGFHFQVSVLGMVQNGKLGIGKTLSLVKMLERALRGFHLQVFRFGYSAKWKTRSWQNSEFGKKA